LGECQQQKLMYDEQIHLIETEIQISFLTY